jgi:hypothetical protein
MSDNWFAEATAGLEVGETVSLGGGWRYTCVARYPAPMTKTDDDRQMIPGVDYGPAPAAGHPLLRCGTCDEVFNDPHGSSIGGLAPYECPRCGEEANLSIIDTDAPQPDSAELADAFDRKAAEIEAAEPGGPAQHAAQSANAAALRRRAREIRARLGL